MESSTFQKFIDSGLNKMDTIFENVHFKVTGKVSDDGPNFEAIFGNSPVKRPTVELSLKIKTEEFTKIG